MNLAFSRKKTLFLTAAVILSLLAAYYYFAIYKSISNISLEGDYKGYSTEQSLSEAAELIVVASPTQDFGDRVHKTTFYPKTNALQDIYTLTNINIEKVIKGPSNIDKNISIVEPIGLVQEIDGLKKISIESYTEMKKGNKYIIFLRKNTYGDYSVINMQFGKFNLDGQDKDDEKSEDKELKDSLKKKINDKYFK